MANIGWLRPGDVTNDTDSEGDEEMETQEMIPEEENPTIFAKQITLKEYEVQKRDFTKAAVENLMNSAEYQRRLNTCSSCWSCWLDNQWCDSCMECGGFALTRACPVCKGKCHSIWKRDIEMSHSNNMAFWNGECGLPPEEREKFLLRMVLEEEGGSEEAMLEAMQDLSTS